MGKFPKKVDGTIGNVRLYLKQLCVETFTKQKFEFAKKRVHRYFGDKVSLKSEKIVDLAKQFARRQEEEFEGDETKPQDRVSDTVPQDIQEKLTTLVEFNRVSFEWHGDRQNKTRNLKLYIGWVLEELGLEELR